MRTRNGMCHKHYRNLGYPLCTIILRRTFAGYLPHQCAARNLDEEVLAGMAVHAFAQTGLAVLGDEPRLVILRDEIVQVMIRFQDHVTATSAIAATGSAFWTILLALEGDAAFAAVSSPGVDPDFVNE